MNYLKLSSSFLLCLVLMAPAFPQKVYHLDLTTSINIAKAQSTRMLVLQQRLERASYDLKSATSKLRTHVSADLIIPSYSETIRQWEDSTGVSFYPVKKNEMSGYLTVSQPLPTDGSLYIRSGLSNVADFYADDRAAQMISSIGFRQPIDAFYGYNYIKNSYKQAQLSYDLSLKQLKREELNLVYDVSQVFYYLLSYNERLNIAKMGLERQQEAYNIALSKYSAGLIREVESLQMEVDLNEAINNFDIAKVNYTSQVSLLKETLGISLKDSIVVESKLDYSPVIIDIEKAVSLAMQNRLELKENELEMELQRMEIKRRRAQGMINGDILVNYNFQGTSKTNLNIPTGTAFDYTWHNLQARPGSFGVGLTINIPIIDWGENRASVNAAKAVMNQYKYQMEGDKVNIERDIRTRTDQLHSSLKRLQMLEKNVTVAEKSFEISRQRYANGDIDSQNMALERERLNNAYVSRLVAFIEYKLNLSDLMRKTFFDFEKGQSVLDL